VADQISLSMQSPNLLIQVDQSLDHLIQARQFQEQFPPLPKGTPFPLFTWEELERQLQHLAIKTNLQAIVPHRLSVMRRACEWFPREMALQELLLEAVILLDESLPPSSEGEEDQMG
jgi:hypothetical protein